MLIYRARIGGYVAEWHFDLSKKQAEVIWSPNTPTRATFIADPNFWHRYTKARGKAMRKLEKITGERVLTVDLGRDGRLSLDDGEMLRCGIHPSDAEG